MTWNFLHRLFFLFFITKKDTIFFLLHCSSFSLSLLFFFLSLSSAKKSLYIDILFKTKQYLPTNKIRLSTHLVFLFLLFFPSLIFTPNSIFLAPRNLDTTKSKNSSYPDFLFQKYLWVFSHFFLKKISIFFTFSVEETKKKLI